MKRFLISEFSYFSSSLNYFYTNSFKGLKLWKNFAKLVFDLELFDLDDWHDKLEIWFSLNILVDRVSTKYANTSKMDQTQIILINILIIINNYQIILFKFIFKKFLLQIIKSYFCIKILWQEEGGMIFESFFWVFRIIFQ